MSAPKPTAIKLLTGNPGNRPLNLNEPQPLRVLPDPPAFLNQDAREEFKRIAEALNRVKVLTEAERALAACALDEVRYRAGGLLTTTGLGGLKANPLVLIADRAMMDVVRISAEFGMTPSSRSRVHVNPVEEDNDPGEQYFKNR